MTELIKKIAEDESLQDQIRSCDNAKTFADLMEIDEAQSEKVFPKVREIMSADKSKIPDELLEQVSGGCSDPYDNPWGDNGGFVQPRDNDKTLTDRRK